MGILDIFKRPAPKRRSYLPRSLRRSFNAADTGRLFAGWTSTPVSPDTNIHEALKTLRARSRDGYINNDYVRRYVQMVKDNVAGPNGVLMQARVVSSSGKPDHLANVALEAAWADWGRRENCDLRQVLTWKEMQRQALASAAIDGEIIAVAYPGAGKYGLKIQHVDPEMLDVGYNTTLRGGNYIKMSIEYDGYDVPVAYHFLTKDNTISEMAENGKRYQRVPAARVVHAFRSEQVGQTRGYPWAAPALGSLKHLDAYIDAAITAARAGAAKMGFIQTQDGYEYVGDGKDADGSVISDFESGIIEQLPAGMSFAAFDPRYPHEQFGEFIKSCLRSISMSLGVSYTGLSGDLEGVNYSSIRSGVLDEREAWKALQEWFIDCYCRPIYEMWLSIAYDKGAIKIGGTPLVKDEEVYRNVNWQGRRWAWVDPAKDMNSNIDAIGQNITTVSAVIREQGKDPDDVFTERAKEKQRMKELGLTEAEVMAPAGQQPGQDNDQEQDDDQE